MTLRAGALEAARRRGENGAGGAKFTLGEPAAARAEGLFIRRPGAHDAVMLAVLFTALRNRWVRVAGLSLKVGWHCAYLQLLMLASARLRRRIAHGRPTPKEKSRLAK
jgi:hypothetical protein